MSISHYTHVNNATTTVSSARSAGVTTLSVASGADFGSPTASNPIRLSVFRSNTPLVILKATARSGNDFTIASAIEGTTDVDLEIGDVVENTPTAGDLEDLWTSLDTVSAYPRVTSVSMTVPSGLSVAGSPITDTGTLAVTTTLSGLIKGNGSGFVAATADTDYATPTYVDHKFISGGFLSNGTDPALSISNGSGINSTVFDKYGFGLTDKMTFLLGVGEDLATGTNVTHCESIACFSGRILTCKVLAQTNGAGGGFTFDIKKNGTSIFTSAPSVAASTTTVQTFTGFAATTVSINDLFTVDVTSVGAGVQNVNITLALLVNNT